MTPPRTPLAQTDGNRRPPNHELTPYERGKIEGAAAGGLSHSQIRALVKRDRSTIATTLRRAGVRQDGYSQPRKGRPQVYSERDQRTMLRNLRLQPKFKFEERRKATGLKMGNTYIKDLARANGLSHWRAKKRPELSEANAAARLLWCRCRASWDVARWRKYCWSDECSVERGSGAEQEWGFGTPADKWKPSMVTTYMAGKQMRVMVWGAFWGDGERCPLFILERDFESKKHGYTADSYLQVLENRLLDFYHDELIFMQDNAAIHTAIRVREWMEENGINTTDWPPYSPDLNPIEHAWWELKKQVQRMFPEVINAKGDTEEDRAELEEALKAAWLAIPDSFFDSLVESMPARIQACIDAKGWHTKY